MMILLYLNNFMMNYVNIIFSKIEMDTYILKKMKEIILYINM